MANKKKKKSKSSTKWTRAKKVWGGTKKVGGAVKKEAANLFYEPVGTVWKNVSKDIPNLVNAGMNVTTVGLSKAGKAVEEFALTSFWAESKGDKADGKLFEFVLDNQKLSGRSITRLKKAIQNGAKVVFITSLNESDACDAVRQLGVALGNDGSITEPRYFIACNDGATILSSASGDFNDNKYIDPKAVENESNGLAKYDSNDVPVVRAQNAPESWIKNTAITDNLKLYKDKHTEFGMSYYPDRQTIILKTDKLPLAIQVANARDIIQSLPLSADELSKYGIGLTLDGSLIIRPLDQNVVNAEFTVRNAAGIKGQNVRRSVSSAAQVSQNIRLDTFLYKFVKDPKTGAVYTPEEASKAGIIDNIAAEIFAPHIEMLSSNSQTNDGSWIARVTNKNRKDIRLLEDYYADYVWTVARRSERVQQHTADVARSIISGTMPLYDMPELVKNKNIVSYQKYLDAKKVGDTATISQFEGQIAPFISQATSTVVQTMMQVPPEYKVYPTQKGFVGRFFYGLTGKSRLPDEIDKEATQKAQKAGKKDDVKKVQRLDAFLNTQSNAVKELVLYSEGLKDIPNGSVRAQEGNDFVEFLVGLEKDIQNGLSQEQVFSRVSAYVKSRDLEAKTQIPVGQTQKGKSSSKGQTNSQGNGGKNTRTNEEEQAYIEQEVLRQNIKASKALIANIKASVNKEELETNPTYKYLNNVLAWEQQQLQDIQAKNGVVDKAPDGSKINKKELQEGLYYSAANTKVIVCNDRAKKIAASEGKEDAVLLDTFDLPDNVKNSAVYKQAQAQTQKGIENVDLTDITDPKVHNAFNDLNNELSAHINSDPKIKDVKLNNNYDMVAKVVTHNLEENNKDMMDIVSKAVHHNNEDKQEDDDSDEDKQEDDDEDTNDDDDEDKLDDENEDENEFERGALFKKLCINPNVDNYRRSRNFMAATVANAKLYMDKNGLSDSVEYEIFNEMSGKWMGIVGAEKLSTIRSAKDRDKETEQLNAAWLEIEKKYANNPEAIAKAQQLWTLCTVQSENTALKYRKEKSSARMVKLTTEQKVSFIMQRGKFNMQQKQIEALINAKSQKDVDRIINNVRASNRKLDNDYKKEKAKLNGKVVEEKVASKKGKTSKTQKAEDKKQDTKAKGKNKSLDDFMDLGKNVKPKTEKPKAKKKTTAKKSKALPKGQTRLDDEEFNDKNSDRQKWASIGMQQFIMQQNIANIKNILNIMPDKNAPEYKKLKLQQKEIENKLTDSVIKEGPCVRYADIKEEKEVAQAIQAVNTTSYNSFVTAKGEGEKLEPVAIPENQQARIIKLLQTKKPEELSPEDQVLYESIKPVVGMALEAKKQKALKDKADFEANKDNIEGYTARTIANKKAEQTLNDIAENGDASVLGGK